MPDTRSQVGDKDATSSVESTPLPTAAAAGVEARFVEVWRAFLGELATDAHKAHAAAIAYRELGPEARDSWIRVLEHDAHQIEAPRIAVYAPLLAVETDGVRRKRILDAIGEVDAAALPRVGARALVGSSKAGLRVAVLVTPLYLSFVQVLALGYEPGMAFEWIRHDPILADSESPRPGESVAEAVLESADVNTLVDELALTVLAHQRSGRTVPEVLRIFADLFGPTSSALATD